MWPGFRGQQSRGDGFEVAHFADQNDVGILAKPGAQGGREICGVHLDFALVDEAFLVAVQEFDGVFDGDDVIGPRGVDAVDHGRERRGFARPGGPGHQNQAALLLANRFDDARQSRVPRWCESWWE